MLQPSKRQLDTSISAKTSDLYFYMLIVRGFMLVMFKESFHYCSFKTKMESMKLNIKIKQLTRRV